MQRLARFFLWMGLALLSVGLLGMMLSCGSQIAELDTGNAETNAGSAVSLFLIIVSLLFIAVGAVLKAVASEGREWSEDDD